MSFFFFFINVNNRCIFVLFILHSICCNFVACLRYYKMSFDISTWDTFPVHLYGKDFAGKLLPIPFFFYACSSCTLFVISL